MDELRDDKRGFTLVELIVVLVILAILAAILVPSLVGYIEQARAQKDYSTAAEVAQAAQAVVIEQKAGHPDWTYENLNPVTSTDGFATNGVKEGDEVYQLAGVTRDQVKWFYFNITNDGSVTGDIVTNTKRHANNPKSAGAYNGKLPSCVCIGDYVYILQKDGSWTSQKLSGTSFNVDGASYDASKVLNNSNYTIH